MEGDSLGRRYRGFDFLLSASGSLPPKLVQRKYKKNGKKPGKKKIKEECS
jgi:hypothetical protein